MADTTTTTSKRRLDATDSTPLGVTGAGENTANGALAEGSASASSLVGVGANSDLQALSQALARQYNNAQYQVRTDAQRQAQAEQEYSAYYSSLDRAARQSTETKDLALQQERDALNATYERNRQQSAQQYAKAYSDTDRQMLSRGMQRSSYGAQTLSNVLAAGAQAQDDLYRQQSEAENKVDQQRTLLQSQLADTLAGQQAERAEAIRARMNELEQQDYDRSVNAANTQTGIASQLYQNLYTAQKDQTDRNLNVYQLNQAQNNENKKNGWDMGSNFIQASDLNTNGDSYYGIAAPMKGGKPVSKGTSDPGGGGGGDSYDPNKKKTQTTTTPATQSYADKVSNYVASTYVTGR